MRTTKFPVRNVVLTAMLGALAFVINLTCKLIPIPPLGGFLQFEISDMPAVLAVVAINPAAGMFVKLIQNIIDTMANPVGMGIGQLANFLVGSSLAVTFGWAYKRGMKTALCCVLAVFAMVVVGMWGNFFIFLPIYNKVIGAIPIPVPFLAEGFKLSPEYYLQIVMILILPFNIFKGVVEVIVAWLVFKALKPFLTGRGITNG